MGIVPVKTPMVVKKLLPDYVWEFPTTENVLYLTFDDGPTPEITQWTLDVLKKFNAKATFFCIGNNIEKHPDILHKILDNGHTIGNHSQTHLKGWRTTTQAYVDDVETAQKIINSQIKTPTKKLFRPPYGRIKPNQGKALMQLGYTIVAWSVLSFDWEQETSPEMCFNNVVSKSVPGSIIVFHDSMKASKNLKYTLPKVLEYFSERNYSFKSINL